MAQLWTTKITGTLHTTASATLADVNFAIDDEASDTYVITLSPAPVAYTTGMRITFIANTANTTDATVNVNALGAKSIVKAVSTALSTNDILALMVCDCVYDGTNFVILNPRAL